jgi:hypothetical protein
MQRQRERERVRARASERASERQTARQTNRKREKRERERYAARIQKKKEKNGMCHLTSSLFLRKLCLQIMLVSSVCPLRQAAAAGAVTVRGL